MGPTKKGSSPGRVIEAEAAHWMLKYGVQGNGFGAIVGSGANGNVLHYRTNGKRMLAGELVVMDYGGALDYMVMDTTRTWPVSGRFDELQLKAYQCALEAQPRLVGACACPEENALFGFLFSGA